MARNKEFNEDVVLAKAMELFWNKGYNATSAQDIVETLGINRSSLYNTYGDKYQLFIRSLRLYQSINTDIMENLVAQTTNPLQTLEDIFRALISNSKDPADPLSKGCFMVNTAIELAPHDAHIEEIVKENMAIAANTFLSLLKKAQSEGQISNALDALPFSRFLANSVNGIRVAARVKMPKNEIEDIVKTTLATLKTF